MRCDGCVRGVGVEFWIIPYNPADLHLYHVVYPNLSVRLKKVHGFYKGFLRFSSIFSVFPRFPH
jgi:hypothetical protein